MSWKGKNGTYRLVLRLRRLFNFHCSLLLHHLFVALVFFPMIGLNHLGFALSRGSSPVRIAGNAFSEDPILKILRETIRPRTAFSGLHPSYYLRNREIIVCDIKLCLLLMFNFLKTISLLLCPFSVLFPEIKSGQIGLGRQLAANFSLLAQYHNAPLRPPQNFAYSLFAISPGT